MKVELAAVGEAPRAGGQRQAHIVFDGVQKHYPGAGGTVQALQSLSCEVGRAEVLGIIGRSGAGKSTLLRTVNGLEQPSGGRVLVGGIDVATLDEEGLVGLRRRIGMVFQHVHLLSSRTVYENLALPLQVADWRPALIRARVDELLALVGLSDQAGAYPARLSAGQKQRVGIARALVHDPEILLCDEATSALDPEATQSILALLRDIHRRLRMTVVLVTHDMALIREACDRVLVLDQGRVQEIGEVWQVFAAPRSEAARALLRPLRSGLPGDLGLVGDLAGRAGEAVLGIVFSEGARQGLPLAVLQALGPRARLLHGGLERLRGRSQGRLLVSLPAQELPPLPSLQQALGADQLQLLGYVPASDR